MAETPRTPDRSGVPPSAEETLAKRLRHVLFGAPRSLADRSLFRLGVTGLLLLLTRAYALGGGTYTGIEAVSNGLPIMREPRVQTAKRTMAYMAGSLAFTATGLLLCYLLWHVAPVEGKTLNAVLVEGPAGGFPGGAAFVVLRLVSEGALLVVAAQAGFLDGPRVLANMADCTGSGARRSSPAASRSAPRSSASRSSRSSTRAAGSRSS